MNTRPALIPGLSANKKTADITDRMATIVAHQGGMQYSPPTIYLTVAVGTTIADRPPHRSVRARLRIRLLPRMNGVEASSRTAVLRVLEQSRREEYTDVSVERDRRRQ